MSLVQNDIEIPDEEPFLNDELGRRELASRLTSLIADADGPLVMSINGRWGTGKTTFIKMWDQMLENEGNIKTLRFNAWENDFVSDPTVVFVEEMTTAIEEDDDLDTALIDLEGIRKAGKEIIRRGIPLLLSLTAGSKPAEEVEKVFEAYRDEKHQIKQFREKIAEVADRVQSTTDSPLLIFIDELDRCRPDFAVELLERVKHLFDVPGIVFILAIDSEQLESSVRSLYGADMDAPGYLRRFIDLQYRLPRPEGGKYLDYLFEQNGTDKVLSDPDDVYRMMEICKSCAAHYEMSLRDKEQYMLRLDLTFRQLNEEPGLPRGYIWGAIPFILAMRMERPEAYEAILRKVDREKPVEEARKFVHEKTGVTIRGENPKSSYRPENFLEAAVRMLYTENADDYDQELKKLGSKMEEYSGLDSSATHEEEKRVKQVLGAMRDLERNGGHRLGERLKEAVELAGRIDRV
jgi:hypothetical protein